MCQWWAAVHKFKLEVKSNLKISTLNLKLDSSDCNKSMRGIQAVAFSWTTVPTDRPAHWRWRGRRRWSTWKLAPPFRAIPPCRCHDRRTYHEIRDITWLWYQKLLISEGLIMAYVLWCHESYHKSDIRYWYHRRFRMICTWYRRQYHKNIAQERLENQRNCDIIYDIVKKVWHHIWYPSHTFLTISE
jgi:hypothetical protein